MNDFVPERAIVPRLFTKSALLMPMPESTIVNVLFVLSGMTWMNSSGCGVVKERKGREGQHGFTRDYTSHFIIFEVLDRVFWKGVEAKAGGPPKRECEHRTWPSSLDLSVRPSKRILSSASEELLWILQGFMVSRGS